MTDATLTADKFESVKTGEVYETKHGEFIVVTSGRLKDEAHLGQSFACRRWKEGKAVGEAERAYLDELAKRIKGAELKEAIAVDRREREGIEDAGGTPDDLIQKGIEDVKKKNAGRKAPTAATTEPIVASKKSAKAPKAAARKTAKPASVKTAKAPKAKAARKPKAAGEKKMSGLDAAAEILGKAKEPMTANDIADKALKSGLWVSNGATPGATLYSAMIREIATKKKDSRFKKAGPGKFSAK